MPLFGNYKLISAAHSIKETTSDNYRTMKRKIRIFSKDSCFKKKVVGGTKRHWQEVSVKNVCNINVEYYIAYVSKNFTQLPKPSATKNLVTKLTYFILR